MHGCTVRFVIAGTISGCPIKLTCVRRDRSGTAQSPQDDMERQSQLAAALEWTHGPNNPLPQGEVGVLKTVEKSTVSPPGQCCVLT